MRKRSRSARGWVVLAVLAVLAADVAVLTGRIDPVLTALAPVVPGDALDARRAAATAASGVAAPRPDALPARGTAAPDAAAPRPAPLPTRPPRAADRLVAYRGLGAWVDVFDYAPAFQDPGTPPAVAPAAVDAMAAAGVRTIYLQAARDDPRSPGDIAHPQLFAEFLRRAHARGIRVVAWYLPTLGNPDADLRRLLAIHRFESGGHRVDGLAVDIEWVRDVRDPAERSRRLVALSRRLRDAVGGATLGAIVMPPVDTDVVNPRFWPGFPWEEIGGLYDVWLPMGYWTNRRGPWRDAGRYTDHNIRRLRAHLGRPDAPVHVIGGIGDLATSADYRAFAAVAARSGAIGLSVYDWDTAAPVAWEVLSGR